MALAVMPTPARAQFSYPREQTRLDITITAAADVNPDDKGRAAPILVRLYELKSEGTFESADYFSLQTNDKALIEHGTPGLWVEHAAVHSYQGPRSRSVAANSWPDTRFNEQFIVKDPAGKPIGRVRYRIRRDDGVVIEGVTDADGLISMQQGVDPASLDIDLLGIQE